MVRQINPRQTPILFRHETHPIESEPLSAAASSIDCDTLSVTFGSGVRAVDDVSLHIQSGKIVSLIGPSGCGKTTLLRLIAGLQTPTSGTVTLTPTANSRSGEVAFVFQQPNLIPWRTAIENVLLPFELMGRASKQDRDAAKQILDIVKLSDALNRKPHQLSGGMKMRVSLARALVTNPKVLLLDEPFAALDDMLRTDLGELLLGLWERHQFTAVMVTHNIAEAILLSHQIVVMRNGKVSEPVENPLPWPRSDDNRRTSEFGSFYGRISDALRGTANTEI